MSMEAAQLRRMRLSLVFVWLATAAVSALEFNGQSRELVRAMGVEHPVWHAGWVGSGIALDVVLGVALWIKPGRVTYLVALGAMLVMTLIATVLLPELWWHPLGPLTKNVPIAVMLWVLAKQRT